ncbi:ABC transporter permease [uncultured Agrococcus sp.]|uniref:ABC transporter permease n=1 Tax=uncultured Agrococcus sp. TaxID=382258 RepID=UPI0025D0462B|nr:ABC transporter permease [uncultured Agrococcus sp.]
MNALARLTGTETKLFLREPIGVIFALVLPPALLIILGLIPAFREVKPELDGLRVIDVYTPIVIALGIATLALTNLPQQLATYRERGILRRMRTTPVTPATLLGAQLLMSMMVSLVTMAVLLAIARFAFAVPLPDAPFAFFLAFVLSAAAMFSVGLLVAALAPGASSASAMGLVLFFAMLFFAGLWISRNAMHDVLRTISDFTPLGAGVQSLHDAAAGNWPSLLHILVVLGWTIVAGGLAARLFRWE